MTEQQKKLVEENHNLIYGFLHKQNLDPEEYYDLAAIALCEAAQIYDPDRGISFSTLGYRCMYNCIGHEIRKSNTKKRQGAVLSYYQATTDDSTSFLDLMESARNVEKEAVFRIMLKNLMSNIAPKHRKILYLPTKQRKM